MLTDVLYLLQRMQPLSWTREKTEKESVVIPIATIFACAMAGIWYWNQRRQRCAVTSGNVRYYGGTDVSNLRRTPQTQHFANDFNDEEEKTSALVRGRNGGFDGNTINFTQYFNSNPYVDTNVPNLGATVDHHSPNGPGASTLKDKAHNAGMTYVREHMRRPRGYSRGVYDQIDNKS